MAKRSLDIVIAGHDKTHRAFTSAGTALSELKSKMLSFRNVAVGGLGVYGLVRGMRAVVTASSSFEQQLATVNTMLAGEGEQYMDMYRRSIRDLAAEYGEGTETLSKGLYDILSSSVAPAKAIDVLRVSIKAAKAGVTDAAVAVDGLTSLLNAYGLAAEQAADVSDLMFATVKSGKLNFESLAANIGKVAPMARAAGMSIEDMLAAIATLTRQGLSTEEATTRLVNVLKAMPEAANDLLQTVQKFRGMKLEDILKIVPNTRAAAGLATMAADIDGMRRDMELMRNAAGSAGDAFAKMADTPAFKLAQARQQLTNYSRALGEAIIPSVLLMTQELKNNNKQLQAWAVQVVRGGVHMAKFVSVNRDLVIGLGKTSVAFGGLIVLGPPLIGMIKGVSTACLFLVKNPMVLLGVTTAAVVASFVDWDSVLERIKDRLGVITPYIDELTASNRAAVDAVRSEHTELKRKAERLAELREKQRLSNTEMLEARSLAHDLAASYPDLSDKIDQLGKSAATTANFLDRLNQAEAQRMREIYQKQLKDAESDLKALGQMVANAHDARNKLVELRSELDATPKNRDPYLRGIQDTFSFFGNNNKNFIGKELYLFNEIDSAQKLADRYDDLRQEYADTEREAARLRDILTEPTNAADTKPTFLDTVKEGVEQIPAMVQQANKALNNMSLESIQKDISAKNADLLHNLKVIQSRSIADDLARETEQIRLAYEKRIEIARKAGQDIKLLEQARDLEIAQARAKAEKEQAKERTARAKGLASDITRLWINTTKTGLEREMALLKQSEREDLAAAQNDKERALILWKYELRRRQAAQNAQSQIPDQISIGAVDRGFLTQAPGQYDPYRDAQKKQQEIIKNTAAAAKAGEAAAKAGEAALALLSIIAEKIGTTQKVADF